MYGHRSLFPRGEKRVSSRCLGRGGYRPSRDCDSMDFDSSPGTGCEQIFKPVKNGL